MSVPPQLIRVKRKATEETPVSYLRVQESKRHRSEVFVYQRQDEEAAFAECTPQAERPIIHTSPPPTRQAAAFQSIVKQNTDTSRNTTGDDNARDTTLSCDTAAASTNTLNSASEPRRFHMSRKDMMLDVSPHPGRPHGGVSKKRSAPALFVERRIKRISPKTIEKLRATSSPSTELTSTHGRATQSMEINSSPEPRKFKKPGIAKLTAKEDTPKYKADLPKAMTDRWNVDMEKLTADMEEYAMQQIGLNLQRAENERREQEKLINSTPSKLKFKPKPPAKRYAERHPQEVQESVDKEMLDVDAVHSDSDDDDYIIETYVRVPASRMGNHVPPQSVGLLVFDEEPDIEFFYGEDDESEDEWAEDEEDENAENYYTADYPDEEVASDDEFDQNPYSFRTGNASDLEEYDVDDDYDDKEGNTSQFKTYIGRNGLKSNHL
ncbi:hypothetical protein F5Y19DRAFT_318218 [Xylariaceae sp. FL1651]|nr:hypothetical protein F5Y19DRAFT_318218 [Xylariaceae sp. FL1651]